MYDEDALRRLVGKMGIDSALAQLANIADDNILNTDFLQNNVVLANGDFNVDLIYSLA